MVISVVFDGKTRYAECMVGWGFSCYLHEVKLLFDTGEDPYKLRNNLHVLGIPQREIVRVFLSHCHFDHIRGIFALEDAAPQVWVARGLLDSDFQKALQDKGFVLSNGNGLLAPPYGVFRVIQHSGLVEQALVIRGERGLSLLFGCAHWGLDRWVEMVRSQIDGPIDLVMGGYHLLGATPRRIQQVIDELLQMGVRRVAPCHCTGSKARHFLQEAFGENFLDLSVGDVVEI